MAMEDLSRPSLSALSNAVSVVSQALSVETANRASAVNRVSNALSAEIVDRVSADNTLSGRVDLVSTSQVALSLFMSIQLSALSAGVSNARSVADAASNAASVVSAAVVAEGVTRANAIVGALNAISVVSQAVSVVSVAAANALSVANAASNAASVVSVAVNVVSQAVSVETANRISAVGALSSRVDTVSNVLATAINTVSQIADSEISNRGSAVAAEISNRTSADNALSNLISAVSAKLSTEISAISQALSVERVNRTSADNVLSVAIDVVSAVAAGAAAGNTYLTLQNNDTSALSAGIVVYGGASAATMLRGDAAAVATRQVIGFVTNSAIAVSASGTVQTGGVISLASASWDERTGDTGGLVPGTIYYVTSSTPGQISKTAPTFKRPLGVAVNATQFQIMLGLTDDWEIKINQVSALAANATSIANAASANAISVGNRVSLISADLTSTQGRLDSESAARSAISANLTSVASRLDTVSADATSAKNRLSAVSADLTSTQTRLDSASAAAAAVSAAVTSVNQAVSVISVQVASALSIANAASNAASVVSVVAANALSVANAASAAAATVSAAVTSVNQAISVISVQVVSALSIANAASAAAANASAAITSVNAAVTSINQLLSVISAGMGTTQLKVVGGVQGVSATGGIKISGLSASVAASGVYQLEAVILYSTSGTVNVYALGMSTSGATFGPIGGSWEAAVSIINNAMTSATYVVGNFNAINGTQLSVLPGTTGVASFARMNAVVVISTTGGTLRLKGRVSAAAAPLNIMKGSFFRAYKIA